MTNTQIRLQTFSLFISLTTLTKKSNLVNFSSSFELEASLSNHVLWYMVISDKKSIYVFTDRLHGRVVGTFIERERAILSFAGFEEVGVGQST